MHFAESYYSISMLNFESLKAMSVILCSLPDAYTWLYVCISW